MYINGSIKNIVFFIITVLLAGFVSAGDKLVDGSWYTIKGYNDTWLSYDKESKSFKLKPAASKSRFRAIKTENNQFLFELAASEYLSASDDGTVTIRSNPWPWERFTVEYAPNQKYYLRSSHDNYLRLNYDINELDLSSLRQDWEAIEFIKEVGDKLVDGEWYAIKGFNNTWASYDKESKRFILKSADSKSRFRALKIEDNKFAFQLAPEEYLSASHDGTVTIRGKPWGWEIFTIEEAPDQKYYLLSSHGNYLRTNYHIKQLDLSPHRDNWEAIFFNKISPTLTVLSYNICHECMTNKSEGSAGELGKICTWTTKDNEKVTICAANIATQIDNISAHYDFVGLQEPANWEQLQQISTSLKNLKAVNHRVVSLYDGQKYNLQKAINTNFENERGRPIQILIFKEGIIFVNLHAPHAHKYKDQTLKEYTEKNLSKALKKLKLTEKELEALKNYRIIVVGDFNDHDNSLFNDNQNKNYFVPFRGANLLTPVFLSYDNKNDLFSCCSTAVPYKKPPPFVSDYIFDSESKNMNAARLRVPSSYDYNLPSSDHLPVIYEVTD